MWPLPVDLRSTYRDGCGVLNETSQTVQLLRTQATGHPAAESFDEEFPTSTLPATADVDAVAPSNEKAARRRLIQFPELRKGQAKQRCGPFCFERYSRDESSPLLFSS